jgi:transposase
LFAEQQLSNRKIAKALNVGETTVRRDTAPNGAPKEQNLSQTNGAKHAHAPFGAPALLEGEQAARLITNKAETYDSQTG